MYGESLMKKAWILIGLLILFGAACSSCQHQDNDSKKKEPVQDESAINTLFGQSAIQPVVKPHKVDVDIADKPIQGEDLNKLLPHLNNFVNLTSYKGILTFDDGPHPKTTQLILENLHTARVQKAIFFLVGYRMMEYPFLVKLIDQYGYEIGYHSMFHQEYDSISEKEICQDIASFKKLLNNTLSKEYPLQYARPLHSVIYKQNSAYISETKKGKYTEITFTDTFYKNNIDKSWLQALNKNDLKVMLWHADFNDWNNPMNINKIQYFCKGNINQTWLFHEMPLHFEIMAAFDNKIDKKLPIFLNQLYRLIENQ
ncbi:chitooligosaccharide deacetylase [Candidatus Magnetomorum sp. HK-1]|nr:chitooligosaccharide deacetylase [Candidatus Magnetomorum sp. HK-1]